MSATTIAKILLAAGALWAVVGLAVQGLSARRAARRDRAAPAGSALAGVAYGFTTALSPARKESASRHPFTFAAGAVLHLGVLASLVTVLASAALPAVLPPMRLALACAEGAGLAACVFLLVRRLRILDLREISPLDDYLANVMIGLLLASALAFLADALPASALHVLTAILLFYLPFGKLRHALFFFLARGEMSARLGHRGVYPPAHGGPELRR